MTSAQLDSLNRRTRILKHIEAGYLYDIIAKEFGVTRKWVNQIALDAGIKVEGATKERRKLVAEGAD